MTGSIPPKRRERGDPRVARRACHLGSPRSSGLVGSTPAIPIVPRHGRLVVGPGFDGDGRWRGNGCGIGSHVGELVQALFERRIAEGAIGPKGQTSALGWAHETRRQRIVIAVVIVDQHSRLGHNLERLPEGGRAAGSRRPPWGLQQPRYFVSPGALGFPD